MRCLIAILFAVVLAVDGKAMPDGNVETQEIGTQQFDYLREAKIMSAQIKEQVKLFYQDQLTDRVKEYFDEYIKNKTEEIKSKNAEMETLWMNIRTKRSEAMEKTTISPETTERMNQMHAKFQEAIVKDYENTLENLSNVEKIVQENLSKAEKDFAKIVKQAIDIAVQESQNLNN